jgi:hypothetical protein
MAFDRLLELLHDDVEISAQIEEALKSDISCEEGAKINNLLKALEEIQ